MNDFQIRVVYWCSAWLLVAAAVAALLARARSRAAREPEQSELDAHGVRIAALAARFQELEIENKRLTRKLAAARRSRDEYLTKARWWEGCYQAASEVTRNRLARVQNEGYRAGRAHEQHLTAERAKEHARVQAITSPLVHE